MPEDAIFGSSIFNGLTLLTKDTIAGAEFDKMRNGAPTSNQPKRDPFGQNCLVFGSPFIRSPSTLQLSLTEHHCPYNPYTLQVVHHLQLDRKRTEEQILASKTGLSKVTTSSEDISYRECKQVKNAGVLS